VRLARGALASALVFAATLRRRWAEAAFDPPPERPRELALSAAAIALAPVLVEFVVAPPERVAAAMRPAVALLR